MNSIEQYIEHINQKLAQENTSNILAKQKGDRIKSEMSEFLNENFK